MQYNKLASAAFAALLVFAGVPAFGAVETQAAGVDLTVTPATATFNTATQFTLAFDTSVDYPAGATINVYFDGTTSPVEFDGGAALTGSDVTVSDTANSSDGTWSTGSFTDDGFVITLDSVSSGPIPAGDTITIVIGDGGGVLNDLTPAPVTPGNYDFRFGTSTGDFGAALVYVSDENDVQVSAVVVPTLAFVIRNAADDADQPNVGGATIGPNVCELGVLDVSTVSTCDYRLKVTTNNVTGYTVNITTDGPLDTAGGTDIANVVDDAAFAAGTPAYGISTLTGGSVTGGGTLTESALAGTTFDVDSSPIDTLSSVLLVSSDSENVPSGTDLTNTTLVEHSAAIDAAQPAGLYQQIVTYEVALQY